VKEIGLFFDQLNENPKQNNKSSFSFVALGLKKKKRKKEKHTRN